jgi:hypothetical protein
MSSRVALLGLPGSASVRALAASRFRNTREGSSRGFTSSVGLGFTRGGLSGDCKGSGASASRLLSTAVKMEAKSVEQRCAIITGVARPTGIGRHLVYGFLGQVSSFLRVRVWV